MFTKTARFYDAVYGFKDYAREVRTIESLVASKIGGSLLDIACGTGKHLEHLRNSFACEGLDLDPELLKIAAERLPDVPFHLGDMAAFDLGREFEVVTCLFSAIGYVESRDRLDRAIANIARHTRAGGKVIVEPWLLPQDWQPGKLHGLFVDEPTLKLARMSVTTREGDVSVVRFEYLISTSEGIERHTEIHRLGLFSREDYMRAFDSAGLDVEFLEGGLTGRGLYIGSRRSQESKL